MDLFETNPIDLTAALATALVAHVELPSAIAAVLAVVDAIERGRWPAGPLERVLALLSGGDAAEMISALGTLIAAEVVVHEGGDRYVIHAEARQTLIELGPVRRRPPTGQYLGLAALLAPNGAAVVAIDESPESCIELVDAATTREVLVIEEPSVHALRDAWLRGQIAVIALGADLAWIADAGQVPVRIVACLEPRHAGVALALLRRHRPAASWYPPAVPRAKTLPPPALEPLVFTNWNGIRSNTPAIRVAALRGTASRIDRAAVAVASAHGVRVQRASGHDPASIRDALVGEHVVVQVGEIGALTALEAAALGALIEHTTAIVLVGADVELPASIARTVERTIDV